MAGTWAEALMAEQPSSPGKPGQWEPAEKQGAEWQPEEGARGQELWLDCPAAAPSHPQHEEGLSHSG